jgi:flagellar biosynthesis protein FlhF
MQIKKFEAKNMTTALRMIKGELGPEAVILSARSLRRGKGFFGSMKYAGVEVTAAIDNQKSKILRGNSTSAKKEYANLLNRATVYGNPAPDDNAAGVYSSPGHSYPKHYFRNQKADSGNNKALSSLYQQILAQGVDRGIASELIDEIKRTPASKGRLTNTDFRIHLCSILEEMGVWADKNVFAKGRPNFVAFIGTTGVGKTTTIAKLAALQKNRRKKQVAVITIDNYGIAANEPLKTYARIIGVPLATAANTAELKQAINKFKSKDLILIDTPGLNLSDQEQLLELKTYFTKIPQLQKHLVVSATIKEKDLIAISERLKDFGVQCLLFTKLDESSTFGNLINVLLRTNLPVSFLCCGRKVPDDIEGGSVQKLVDLMLPAKNRDPGQSIASSGFTTDRLLKVQDRTIKRSYFLANKNSDVYHCADCRWSKKIKPDNIIQFASIQAAEAQNFLPCRSCNPDRLKSDDTKDSKTAKQNYSRHR